MTGVQHERDVLTAESLRRGGYPRLKSCRERYYIPWGFLAQYPQAALILGLEFALVSLPSLGDTTRAGSVSACLVVREHETVGYECRRGAVG